MFRQKFQKNLTTITPPDDRRIPKEQEQPQEAPVRQLSLLERRQLRQQQLGLEVPLLGSRSRPSDVISKITPVISPPVDLSNVYTVDKTRSLGEESQFKVAYKATKKGDSSKNYVMFVFKQMNGSEPQKENKEIKTFKKLIQENRCETHAICPVQVGIFEGAVAIVTEFIEGITLAKLVEILKERDQEEYQNNNLTIQLTGNYKLGYLSALQLFEKIIRSLQFIHNTWHFVHLDLKPDNIMISNDLSSVYIIDLGSGCFSPEFVKENCEDRFAAEGFIAPESVFPDEGYWDFNENSSVDKLRDQFENWKKADIFSIGKVFDYLLMQNLIQFSCDTQKEQLLDLIKKMTNENYNQRPDSSQVFSELLNLKSIQCAGSISQLARCFF